MQFEKLCSNDKVIQSITALIAKNKEEKKECNKKFGDLQVKYKSMNNEVESLNKQLEELDRKEKEIIKQITE